MTAEPFAQPWKWYRSRCGRMVLLIRARPDDHGLVGMHYHDHGFSLYRHSALGDTQAVFIGNGWTSIDSVVAYDNELVARYVGNPMEDHQQLIDVIQGQKVPTNGPCIGEEWDHERGTTGGGKFGPWDII